MILAVYFKMPRTAVPMIEPREIEDPRSGYVEGNIEVWPLLIKKMRCIGTFVPAASIIGTAHVCAHSQSLQRPVFDRESIVTNV